MNYGKKGSKKRQAELTSKGIMYGKKMRVIFCQGIARMLFCSCNYRRKPWIWRL